MKFVTYSAMGGFGDDLMTCQFAQILCDNGVEAAAWTPNMELTTVPKFMGSREEVVLVPFAYDYHDKTPILKQNAKRFELFYHHPGINITRQYPPTLFYYIHTLIKEAEVVIHSRIVPKWCKRWPYFCHLKKELTKRGIKWLDVNNLYGVKLLNTVQRAKLFVGVESGVAHYVSHIARGKGLIILSGMSNPPPWWGNYDYEYIKLDLPCMNCACHEISRCPHGHKCMRDITVEMVADAISRRLNKS